MFVGTFDFFLPLLYYLDQKYYFGHRGKLTFPPKIRLTLLQRDPIKPPDDDWCPPTWPTNFRFTLSTLTPLHGTDLLHMNWTKSFVIVVPLTFLNNTSLMATLDSCKTQKYIDFGKLLNGEDFSISFSFKISSSLYVYLLLLLNHSFGQWWLGSWRFPW